MLVVVQDPEVDGIDVEPLQELERDDRMLPQRRALVGIEPVRLLQDRVRDGDLAEIVEEAREAELRDAASGSPSACPIASTRTATAWEWLPVYVSRASTTRIRLPTARRRASYSTVAASSSDQDSSGRSRL